MADPQLIEWLRQLRGVEREYFDFRGQHQRVSDASLQRILEAFGHDLDDDRRIVQEARQLSEKDWRRVLPPAAVLRRGRNRHVAITVLRPLLDRLVWRLTLEAGGHMTGYVEPSHLPVLEERALDDLHFARLALSLPEDIPLGYHQLRLETAVGQALGHCRLIVAPERCYEPESMAGGDRLWGIAVQLYSVRSRRNWGIGDFTDLKAMIDRSAPLGVDVIGLNPLHALFPADPSLDSPYSPASRQFLNPIYVDPEATPEFAVCKEARGLVAGDAFQARLSQLRSVELVDYPAVWGAKEEVFRLLHQAFEDSVDTERRHDFEQFIESTGKSLEYISIFYALQQHFSNTGCPGGWQAWPEAYHRPDSDAVQAFGAKHRGEVRYHMYLQWLAHEQLQSAENRARRAGMKVGIYRDLAVGINGGGPEAWADQDLYASATTIGAPPDPLALNGQDWGIPPMRPDVLRERSYQPFIDLLRANMGEGGALRIDHVMVLYRLWWVPSGRPSAEGTYVYYDLDAMMSILALESQRHKCLVIGEDLGTVPEAIRHAMPDFGVYSYRVFYFEHDPDGLPRRPANYPAQTLVTVSTHDLPPLASFWRATDIELRQRLALYPDEDTREQTLAGRVRQRRMILAALHDAGLHRSPGDEADRLGQPISQSLAEAVQVYLARSRARLMVVQPEDWLYMETPVNVPGTRDEHANWQRKLDTDLEDWLEWDDVSRLARRITDARQTRPGG